MTPAKAKATAGPARAKRPKDRADQILAAASQLFRERGYHAVGIDEIGAAVGITGPAVYRHYASKAALLVAAAERSVDRFNAAYAEGVASGVTPAQKLEALARANIVHTLEDLDLAAVLMREYRHIPEDIYQSVRERQRVASDLWIGTIRSARPDLSRRDATFVAAAALGVCWSLIHYNAPLPRRRLEDVLTRVSLAAMLAKPSEATSARAADVFGRMAARRSAPNGDVTSPYRGSRREVILASAIRLFKEHGYGGVGIDDIGAAAGITGPAVYRHFDSKDDLLAAALNRLSEQLAASVGRALSGVRSPCEGLERLVETFLELEIENADLVFVYLTQSQALSAANHASVRRAQRNYVDEWVTLLREARPELTEAEGRVMVHAAIGIINTYSHMERPRLRLEDIATMLTTMALAGLLDS